MKLKNLTDICRPKQWKTIAMKDLKDEGYPVYGANGVIGFYNDYTHVEDTIMITCRGATCGTINMSQGKSYINGNAMALDDLQEKIINKKYLYYFLLDYDFTDVISGSAQPQITRTNLQRVKIPVPSLHKQNRIVEVLDKIRLVIEQRKKQLSHIDKLTEAIFYDMFGDPLLNIQGWEVSEIRNFVANRIPNIKVSDERGISYIDISSIDNKQNKIVHVTDYDLVKEAPSRARKMLQYNDVILSTVRPNLKNVALFNMDTEHMPVGSTGFCILRPNKHLNSTYLFYTVKSESFTQQLVNMTKGASYPAVSDRDIKGVSMSLPPINLQEEFSEKIGLIEEKRNLLQSSLQAMEEYYQSVRHRAFLGKLLS